MASFEFLDAVNQRKVCTTTHVAEALGISEAEALRQLREAGAAGFVCEEFDESHFVPKDFDRQVWRLTDGGRREHERQEDLELPGSSQ